VLVGGLPGTGKSTVARGLAQGANCTLIRSDVVRKQLAGLAETDSGRHGRDEGIYARAWNDRTYAECLRLAAELLLEGRRVVVDATFGEERRRRDFLERAAALAVPAVLLLCRAEPAVVRGRLANRRGDASDADWSIYEHAAARWEVMSPATEAQARVVNSDGTVEQALAQVDGFLQELALVDLRDRP
jgi:predicted kinase